MIIVTLTIDLLTQTINRDHLAAMANKDTNYGVPKVNILIGFKCGQGFYAPDHCDIDFDLLTRKSIAKGSSMGHGQLRHQL